MMDDWGRGDGWGMHETSTGSWLAMALMMLIFVLAFGALIFWLVRGSGQNRVPPTSVQGQMPTQGRPESLLAERFARGDIDEDEYRRRLSVLRDG